MNNLLKQKIEFLNHLKLIKKHKKIIFEFLPIKLVKQVTVILQKPTILVKNPKLLPDGPTMVKTKRNAKNVTATPNTW